MLKYSHIIAPISLNILHKYTDNNSTILKNDISGKTQLSVSKQVSTHWDIHNKINVYQNEKYWLNKLQNSDIIAKPIHYNDDKRIITTQYIGETINKNNIPKNWKNQRDYIINTLQLYNCRHNDIKPNEILVDKQHKIRLVDFGWAHNNDKPNPPHFPKYLGSEFKCNMPNKEYDDKCSFNKSIYYILNKKLPDINQNNAINIIKAYKHLYKII